MPTSTVPESLSGGGMGVDKFGAPVVDPTKNVLDLVKAGRDADTVLRETIERYQEKLTAAQHDRNDDLARAESRRMDDLAALRLQYDTRIAEDLRLNVKTTSDQLAGQLVKETASLANQIKAMTDSLISQINAQSMVFTSQLSTLRTEVVPQLAELNRFRYESGGKTSVSDPAISSAIAEMARTISMLKDFKGQESGKDMHQASTIAISAVVISLIVGGFSIFNNSRATPSPAYYQQPPVVPNSTTTTNTPNR